MSSEQRLQALWILDEPPARDPTFVFATMNRLARRQLWIDAMGLVPLVIAAFAVFGATASMPETNLQIDWANPDVFVLWSVASILMAMGAAGKLQPDPL